MHCEPACSEALCGHAQVGRCAPSYICRGCMKAYAAYFVPDMIHKQLIRCDLLVKYEIIRFLCSHVPLNTAFSEVSHTYS